MSKFDWEKENIKKNGTKNKTAVERWKEVKDAFVMATKGQKRVILQYDMFPSSVVGRLSKKAASDIISKYAKEHGWESRPLTQTNQDNTNVGRKENCSDRSIRASRSQKKLIRKYKMHPSELIDQLSKKEAYTIIARYAKKNNWKKR